MDKICREQQLLSNEDGIVRVPFLVKGKLISPPRIDRSQIEKVFSCTDIDVSYVTSRSAVIRELVITAKP
jgi:hypothetical protein